MSNNSLTAVPGERGLPKRIDKALEWLAESRDKWKDKCTETKLLLKRQNFLVKRIKQSRDEWKLRHIRLKQALIQEKQTVSSLQRRIDELESQLEGQILELRDVKKKK
jgi:chromosome segregation ATPase